MPSFRLNLGHPVVVEDPDELLLDEPSDDEERDDERMIDMLLDLGVDLDAIHEPEGALPDGLVSAAVLARLGPDVDDLDDEDVAA